MLLVNQMAAKSVATRAGSQEEKLLVECLPALVSRKLDQRAGSFMSE